MADGNFGWNTVAEGSTLDWTLCRRKREKIDVPIYYSEAS